GWRRRWRWFWGNHSRFPSPDLRQALRHSLIKLLFALQEGVESAKEHPRLRALDDAVIVRARDRDDLRAGDFSDGPGRDDGALALHQARHRGDGSEGTRIGQLDRATGKVV